VWFEIHDVILSGLYGPDKKYWHIFLL
jgi:hypothetical protein